MISATGLVLVAALRKGGSMPSIRVRPVQLTILVTVLLLFEFRYSIG